MLETNVTLPSKPRVVSEIDFQGVYEIDGLYPGYGHTLGNSLRRIILASLPGATITEVKIDGVQHEFATIEGINEDVITILLNLKRVRFQLHGEEPMTVSIKKSGIGEITAGDIICPSQVEILNPEQHIA
ncbi:DNA-directed RNA polymerase subunit alpha, partial [Candidatus Kaiserbacteria bacterium CG_4_8_14_3_um_filter_38_9]